MVFNTQDFYVFFNQSSFHPNLATLAATFIQPIFGGAFHLYAYFVHQIQQQKKQNRFFIQTVLNECNLTLKDFTCFLEQLVACHLMKISKQNHFIFELFDHKNGVLAQMLLEFEQEGVVISNLYSKETQVLLERFLSLQNYSYWQIQQDFINAIQMNLNQSFYFNLNQLEDLFNTLLLKNLPKDQPKPTPSSFLKPAIVAFELLKKEELSLFCESEGELTKVFANYERLPAHDYFTNLLRCEYQDNAYVLKPSQTKAISELLPSLANDGLVNIILDFAFHRNNHFFQPRYVAKVIETFVKQKITSLQEAYYFLLNCYKKAKKAFHLVAKSPPLTPVFQELEGEKKKNKKEFSMLELDPEKNPYILNTKPFASLVKNDKAQQTTIISLSDKKEEFNNQAYLHKKMYFIPNKATENVVENDEFTTVDLTQIKMGQKLN